MKNPTAKDLAMEHARLIDEVEKLTPGAKAYSKKTERILALEKELRKRLIAGMVGNPFPPDKKVDV